MRTRPLEIVLSSVKKTCYIELLQGHRSWVKLSIQNQEKEMTHTWVYEEWKQGQHREEEPCLWSNLQISKLSYRAMEPWSRVSCNSHFRQPYKSWVSPFPPEAWRWLLKISSEDGISWENDETSALVSASCLLFKVSTRSVHLPLRTDSTS